MSSHELKDLLDQVADTREIVLRRPLRWSADYSAWSDARDEALVAYGRWRTAPAADTYAAYRAAQDREDAAQDTLAQIHTSHVAITGGAGRPPAGSG